LKDCTRKGTDVKSGIQFSELPNARDQRRHAVGAPLALVASGMTTSVERRIA
jgi:hypothetical protein